MYPFGEAPQTRAYDKDTPLARFRHLELIVFVFSFSEF